MTETAGPGHAVRVARAGLLRSCEPAAPGVAALIDRVGAVAAWAAVCSRERVDGAGDRWITETASRTRTRSAAELMAAAEADLLEADRCGARLVIPEDTEWPETAAFDLGQLAVISKRGQAAPLALYVRGDSLAALPQSGVAIVGSRDGTPYGRTIAAGWAHELADRGFTVISGAAYGIDAAAHRGALAADAAALPTVAVLACGIERAYPAEHARLLGAIAERGAVVSEYPPGAEPLRIRFLVRNRLIAALGSALLVVEAGERSGSMSTATYAERLNRVRLAVPGPITSKMSAGCHRILREPDCLLATSVQDVLAVLRPDRFDVDQDGPETEDLGTAGARVFDALLPRMGRSVTDVAARTGLPTSQVWEELVLLQLGGRARKAGQGWSRAAGP